MEEKIKKRIIEKIETLVDRVEFIEKNLSADMLENRILKKAIYKEFQEAVEAMTDACALMRRSLNSSAQDDYSNIDFLMEKEIFERELGKKLKEANGLRNRLIHEYNGLNDKIAYKAIKELLQYLKKFSEETLKWMKEK